MFFKKKVERVVDLEKSEKKKKKLENEPLEKGDIPAMILAGCGMILPIMLVVVAAILLIIWLFFLR